MKWQTTALALASLAGSCLATPVAIAARDGLEVYKLRISSRTQSLDGRYLGVNGSQVGVFQKAPDVQVYTISSKDNGGLVELHTYPIGIVDHALAMVGSQDLLVFSEVMNPAATSFPTGTTCDWRKFSLTGKSNNSDGKPDNSLSYAGSNGGRWVAFPSKQPSEWIVKWRGADAWTTEDYMPIDIVYETITTEGSYNGGVPS